MDFKKEFKLKLNEDRTQAEVIITIPVEEKELTTITTSDAANFVKDLGFKILKDLHITTVTNAGPGQETGKWIFEIEPPISKVKQKVELKKKSKTVLK